MFFDLLNIKPPDWYQTFIDGRRLTSTWLTILTTRNSYLTWHPVYRRNPKEKKEVKEPKEPDTAQKQQSTLKVTDQYIALLIRVFVAGGLLDVSAFLGILGTDSNERGYPIRRSHQCVKSASLARTFLGRQLYSWPKFSTWRTRFFLWVLLQRYRFGNRFTNQIVHNHLSNYLFSSHRWFHVYSPWRPIIMTANIGSLALRPFQRSTVSIGTGRSWNLQRM